MSLFLALLPIYLLGNFHCIGMCGPLVLMLGRHRYKHFYFFGRLLSYTLAGVLAGGAGAVFHIFLQQFHLAAALSFFFGIAIGSFGFLTLFKLKWPFKFSQKKPLFALNHRLSLLILQDRPFPVFLFGFFTLLLPCGQTAIVYSALALEADIWQGLLNGFFFALFTSPSLFLAMRAQNLMMRSKKAYNNFYFGLSALFIGAIALCRGFAETGLIPHLTFSPSSFFPFHLALY